jgi:eukaryotic-like serine/threonine-protein kinase
MSSVFLAEETALGRRVVIKVPPAEVAEAVKGERFRQEIRLAARLTHPHIVPLLSAGESDGLPWYTMPYVEGESLRVRLARGPLPLAETVSVLRDVAQALAYAHEHGVVHRDIKPDNVLLSGGTAMVTDFGVAKALSAATGSGDAGITTLGVVLGTPAYMAPEQGAGDPSTDHRHPPTRGVDCRACDRATRSAIPPRYGAAFPRRTRDAVPREAAGGEAAECVGVDPRIGRWRYIAAPLRR